MAISKFFESSRSLGRISSKNRATQQMITTSLTSNQPPQTLARNGTTPLIRLTDAHRRDIFALIMRQGAIQTALAVTIGLLFSLAAGRVLARILYQVSPSDPFALVISGALLAAAAMLACFFPARRATHVEPLKALRTE